MGAAPSTSAGRIAARAVIAASPRYTAWPWDSGSVFERLTVAMPEPSGAGDTSAQARATVSETRSKPSRITLASATSTNPRRRANAALSGPPPTCPGAVGAVARIAAKPARIVDAGQGPDLCGA